RPQGGDAVTREIGVLLRLDRLERARLTELDVNSMVELHLLEQLDTSRGEVGLQIRSVAPADRVDLARVDARGSGRDLSALGRRDASSVRGEVECGGCAGDAAADHHDVRVRASHVAHYMMWAHDADSTGGTRGRERYQDRGCHRHQHGDRLRDEPSS